MKTARNRKPAKLVRAQTLLKGFKSLPPQEFAFFILIFPFFCNILDYEGIFHRPSKEASFRALDAFILE